MKNSKKSKSASRKPRLKSKAKVYERVAPTIRLLRAERERSSPYSLLWSVVEAIHDKVSKVHDRINETNERLRVIELDISKMQLYMGIISSKRR